MTHGAMGARLGSGSLHVTRAGDAGRDPAAGPRAMHGGGAAGQLLQVCFCLLAQS